MISKQHGYELNLKYIFRDNISPDITFESFKNLSHSKRIELVRITLFPCWYQCSLVSFFIKCIVEKPNISFTRIIQVLGREYAAGQGAVRRRFKVSDEKIEKSMKTWLQQTAYDLLHGEKKKKTVVC
ncbi:uncharacterized protein LOC120354536 [Nilaparvata lugens]|uniref:uncharacterized protein LOC120354536 n=1 Tax=Nilaparvata lugens TaxID=108931 RepID=UPI00193E43B4|nr:uncharacterized protein LOC120354536 [Nilaparvata lugens]